SLLALNQALSDDGLIFLSAQTDGTVENPASDQINKTGTIAFISVRCQLVDGAIKVLAQGLDRGKAESLQWLESYWGASVYRFTPSLEPNQQTSELMVQLTSLVKKYIERSQNSMDLLSDSLLIKDPSVMTDTIASRLKLSLIDKQVLLEIAPLN